MDLESQFKSKMAAYSLPQEALDPIYFFFVLLPYIWFISSMLWLYKSLKTFQWDVNIVNADFTCYGLELLIITPTIPFQGMGNSIPPPPIPVFSHLCGLF